MKTYCLIFLSIFCLSVLSQAQTKSKSKKNKTTRTIPVTKQVTKPSTKATTQPTTSHKTEIEWLTLEEAEKRMALKPKKLYVDFYTDWCGWCKVMDKKTFTHPEVIQYMNENFYAVKFNTEKRDSVFFQGRYWNINPQYKTNDWAIQMLNGQLSYPSSLIMDNGFQNPILYPGYIEVKNMEAYLKFLGEGHYKKTKWQDYINQFKPTWAL